jgi:hypothetical protein
MMPTAIAVVQWLTNSWASPPVMSWSGLVSMRVRQASPGCATTAVAAAKLSGRNRPPVIPGGAVGQWELRVVDDVDVQVTQQSAVVRQPGQRPLSAAGWRADDHQQIRRGLWSARRTVSDSESGMGTAVRRQLRSDAARRRDRSCSECL